MLSKSKLDLFVSLAVKEVIKEYGLVKKESIFIGNGSEIDSLDIVQIISFVEDKLEENGYEGLDLFEKTFEHENMTFADFSNFLEKQLTS